MAVCKLQQAAALVHLICTILAYEDGLNKEYSCRVPEEANKLHASLARDNAFLFSPEYPNPCLYKQHPSTHKKEGTERLLRRQAAAQLPYLRRQATRARHA
jgi:hypothetical protein